MISFPPSQELKFSDFSNIEKWGLVMLLMLSFTGVSVAQLGKAMVTPFHLTMGFLIGYGILVSSKGDKKISVGLFLFMIYVIFVNVLQYPGIRYTSVLYTLIYGAEIMILNNLLKKCRLKTIIYTLELIINLYLINLFIGLVLDTLNLRLPGVDMFVRVYYEEGSHEGRPMGFSSEPSYAAFILSVVYLSYSYLRNHTADKRMIVLFGKIIMCIIFSKSAYGFLFIGVLILDWVVYLYRSGNPLIQNLIPLFIGIGLFGFSLVSANIENESFVRISKFTTAMFDNTVSGKAKMRKLQEADGSAFARVGPTLLLLDKRDDPSFNFVVGEGAGAAGKFLAKFLVGILVDEGRDTVDTGIIPALVFDYGYIGSLLFLFYIWSAFSRLTFPFWLLFILILPNANINTQLIWFAIACFSFVNIALENVKKVKKNQVPVTA
ncbi:MAG: hypothetical protein AB8F74_09460 [Saprospiraceae bacterium]